MAQKEQKKKYEAPTLAVLIIEMEQGIATSSTGTSTSEVEFTPSVEDWQIEDHSQNISI